MVSVWLVKKGWGMILFGLILFFVVGPITFVFIQPDELTFDWVPNMFKKGLLFLLQNYYRMSVGSGIGAIGIFFIIFGTMYFLATTILEYNKKRRLAHRSKI